LHPEAAKLKGYMETRPGRILCVDDDLVTLRLRKVLLEAAGYSVLLASSGAEALRILSEGAEVDLVLLDYMMPEMNGNELASELRALYPHLRLIAVSAVGQLPASLVDAVDSHVQKGHDPELLLSVVSAVLAGPGSAGSPHVQSPKTILCVDDEKFQLQLRKALLESAGFIVLAAQSSEVAMDMFRTHHVDAVVTDYWLSGNNGTALAEQMKGLRPRIPILMLSGFTSLPGEGAVVDAWLRKAEVEPEELIETVNRLIGLRSDSQQGANS
jgi:CheY-like chemotaxis protein